MNKKERKEVIKGVIDHVEDAKSALDEAINDFESEYDEMSDKVQEGQKGQDIQALLESLRTVTEKLQEVNNDLEGLS